jgi:hypothetical protein
LNCTSHLEALPGIDGKKYEAVDKVRCTAWRERITFRTLVEKTPDESIGGAITISAGK